MTHECAWCGRPLDGPVGPMEPDGEAGRVSHGICAECYDRLSTETGIPIHEFIGSLKEPVLLLDSDHTIGMANDAAMDLVDDGPALFGERTGMVFDCEHAHLPGGCGKAIHCSGCVIRQAVAHTYMTGSPQLSVPATLKVVGEPALRDVALVISTVRVGDRVLLRIEDYHHPG